MITTNLHQQTATCTVCEDVVAIPSWRLRTPDGLLEFTDELKADHRECVTYRADPAKAKLHRGFRKRTERELVRAQTPEQRKQQRFCAGIGRAGRRVTL